MGRLFAVPLLIVSIIVGCAVVVVLLFGEIVSEPERSILELVAVLERPTGDKTAGMLLPQDKETWQAARELALRLTKPDQELAGQDKTVILSRLSELVRRETQNGASVAPSQAGDMMRQKLGFLMASLARVGEPEGVPPLVDALGNASPDTRRDALFALSYYPHREHLNRWIEKILPTLRDDSTDVRIVACGLLPALAVPENEARIADSLATGLDDSEQEVQWNAALGLAGLGDARGSGVLLDLLDRDFWENKVKYRVPKGGNGNMGYYEYPMPAERVKKYLIFAVEAARNLSEPAIWDKIQRLTKDGEPEVAGAAMKAVESRGNTIGNGMKQEMVTSGDKP